MKRLSFKKALKLFIEDCEIRNLRAHTIKFYQNELSGFYKILTEQQVDPAPYKIRSEHIKRNVTLYLKK
jgi:integrase/recombinase XerD